MPRFHPNFTPAAPTAGAASPMDRYEQFQNIQNQQAAVSQAGDAQNMDMLKQLYGISSDAAMQPAHTALLQAQAGNLDSEARNRDITSPAIADYHINAGKAFPDKNEARIESEKLKGLGILQKGFEMGLYPKEDFPTAMAAGTPEAYAKIVNDRKAAEQQAQWGGMLKAFQTTPVPTGMDEATMRAKWGDPAVDYLKTLYQPAVDPAASASEQYQQTQAGPELQRKLADVSARAQQHPILGRIEKLGFYLNGGE